MLCEYDSKIVDLTSTTDSFCLYYHHHSLRLLLAFLCLTTFTLLLFQWFSNLNAKALSYRFLETTFKSSDCRCGMELDNLFKIQSWNDSRTSYLCLTLGKIVPHLIIRIISLYLVFLVNENSFLFIKIIWQVFSENLTI